MRAISPGSATFSRRALLLRALSGAGVAVTAGLLAACGGGSTAVSSVATTKSEAAAPAGKQVQISFYYPVGVAGPLAKIVDGLAKDFSTQNPSIKVTPVFSGSYVDTFAKVQQQVQAGTPPDVAIVNAAAIYSMLDTQSILQLDDLIKKSGGGAYINDFFPGFLENSQLNGKTWSIPFQRSTLIMYYNKDLLKSAGYDPEKPPQTWDDLVATGKKLTKKDASGAAAVWGVGFPSDGSSYWEFQALAIEAGQNVFKNNAGNVVYFNAEPTVAALQFLLDLSHKYGVMQSGTVAWGSLPTDFSAGKVGMIYHSTGSLTAILQASKFQVGAAFCPKDKQFGTPTGGGNLYLFKGSPADHQEAGWSFIQWLSAPEKEVEWTKDTGYVAPRKSAWETQAMKDYIAKTPQVTVARDQLQYAQNELGTHNMAEVQTILSNAIQAALTGQKSPKVTLDAAQVQAEKTLSAFKN
ncbi:MAG: ABC transporter substrate-binding protein [Chloroflexi bacterium]|nr:ABC transporter substrate-binding protein [Chloroflexota bacterium]